MKKIITMLAVSMAMLLSACASSSLEGNKIVTTSLNKLTNLKDDYNNRGGVAGVGEGIASQEQMALSQAQMIARADIASVLSAKSQQLTKKWYEEVSDKESFESNSHQEQVNRDIISEQVSGALTIKMITEIQPDGRYKVAVLMVMSPDIFEKFAEALKNSEAVSEKIRNRADIGYKAAEEEFKQYEEFKENARAL